MGTCQHCGSQRLFKAGHNRSGSQRYSCKDCGRTTTAQPQPNGCRPEVRQRALRQYLDGNGFRAIGRQLGVNPPSVANLVNAYVAHLPARARWWRIRKLWRSTNCLPSFSRKNEDYVVTAVERETRCITSWAVVTDRSQAALQRVIDQGPPAFQCCTDDHAAYCQASPKLIRRASGK